MDDVCFPSFCVCVVYIDVAECRRLSLRFFLCRVPQVPWACGFDLGGGAVVVRGHPGTSSVSQWSMDRAVGITDTAAAAAAVEHRTRRSNKIVHSLPYIVIKSQVRLWMIIYIARMFQRYWP